ncbi:MAG: EAL domain-containing protein [Campylobacterales bacterium]|nr:EAL domain-containing protein [Campylobacterales bacterium]
MKWPSYTHSVSTRLIVNVIVIHAVLMGVMVFDLLKREHAFIQKELSEKGHDLTRILASNTANALLRNDLVALGELIEDMAKISGNYMVFILDAQGRVRASLPKEYFNQTLSDASSKALLAQLQDGSDTSVQMAHDDLVDTVCSIVVSGRVIGYARTLIDAQSLNEELEVITQTGVLYIALATLIGALFAWLSVQSMTANLNRLSHAAQAIADHRFDVTLPQVHSRDEVATMIEAFRVMQTSLREYLLALDESKQRLSLALEGSSDGLWDWDLRSNTLYFSPRYKAMLGYEEHEFEESFDNWRRHLHPDDAPKAIEFIEEFLHSDSIWYEQRFRMRTKSGDYVPILARAKKLFDDAGNAIRLSGTHVDMSQIAALQNFLQQVIDSVEIPLMVIERDHTISLSNTAARTLAFPHGYNAASDVLNCFDILNHACIACDSEETHCPLQEAIRTKRSVKIVRTHTLQDGSTRVMELSTHPVFDDLHEVSAVVLSAYDITSLVEARDSLRHQAEHDVLTGLPNRVLFLDRLQQAIKTATRQQERIGVLFLDLDHFKQINDSLGHDAGDELLRQVTGSLQRCVRSSDTVARLGGDEFTIILDKISKNDAISDVISKIMQELTQPHRIAEQEYYTACSIGIAIFPDDGHSAEELLKNADAAMYRAKAEGRNTYQFYTYDMTARALARISMESALRQALANDEFLLYYQPQVDAAQRKLVGLEALVRWSHPLQGMIAPGTFIPLAEETGLIIALDQWVMRHAMEQMCIWKKSGYTLPKISINLSVLQLGNIHFTQTFAQMLDQTGCKAEWIELELTESQIMKNPDVAIAHLRTITEMGVTLAIDDFGTGYSSLAYLKRLPIHKLKIDLSFIRDLAHDEEDREITRTIIAMARNLSLEVIAEGVETPQQRDFLIEHGCEQIQGYLYSPPLHHQAIIPWLEEKTLKPEC